MTSTCNYCNRPLTDNEYDHESGGYFSAHSACVNECAPEAANFTVTIFRNGVVEAVRFYTNRARAEAEANYLRSWNSAQWACGRDRVFRVHDNGTGRLLLTV